MYGKCYITDDPEGSVANPVDPIADGDDVSNDVLSAEFELNLNGGCGTATLTTVLEWDSPAALAEFELGRWIHLYDSTTHGSTDEASSEETGGVCPPGKWYQGQIDTYSQGLNGELEVNCIGQAGKMAEKYPGSEKDGCFPGVGDGFKYNNDGTWTNKAWTVGGGDEMDPDFGEEVHDDDPQTQYGESIGQKVMLNYMGDFEAVEESMISPTVTVTGLKFDGTLNGKQIMEHLAVMCGKCWGWSPYGSYYIKELPVDAVNERLMVYVAGEVEELGLKKGNDRAIGKAVIEGGIKYENYPATYRFKDAYYNPYVDASTGPSGTGETGLPDTARQTRIFRCPEIRDSNMAQKYADEMLLRYAGAQWECTITDIGEGAKNDAGEYLAPFPWRFRCRVIDYDAVELVPSTVFAKLKVVFENEISCEYELGHIDTTETNPSVGNSLPRKTMDQNAGRERYVGFITEIVEDPSGDSGEEVIPFLKVDVELRCDDFPVDADEPDENPDFATNEVASFNVIPLPGIGSLAVGDKVAIFRIPGTPSVGKWYTFGLAADVVTGPTGDGITGEKGDTGEKGETGEAGADASGGPCCDHSFHAVITGSSQGPIASGVATTVTFDKDLSAGGAADAWIHDDGGNYDIVNYEYTCLENGYYKFEAQVSTMIDINATTQWWLWLEYFPIVGGGWTMMSRYPDFTPAIAVVPPTDPSGGLTVVGNYLMDAGDKVRVRIMHMSNPANPMGIYGGDNDSHFSGSLLYTEGESGGGGGGAIQVKRHTMWHDEATVLSGGAITISTVAGGANNMMYNGYAVQLPYVDGDTFTHGCYLTAGTYTFYVLGRTTTNRGKLDWYVDGVKVISGQDWYSAASVLNVVKSGAVTITTTGWHQIKGVVNGKNAASSNYAITLTKYWFKQASD